jgi:putative ATPase
MPQVKAICRMALQPVRWYEPTDRGMEAKIAEKLDALRELDRKARRS